MMVFFISHLVLKRIFWKPRGWTNGPPIKRSLIIIQSIRGDYTEGKIGATPTRNPGVGEAAVVICGLKPVALSLKPRNSMYRRSLHFIFNNSYALGQSLKVSDSFFFFFTFKWNGFFFILFPFKKGGEIISFCCTDLLK